MKIQRLLPAALTSLCICAICLAQAASPTTQAAPIPDKELGQLNALFAPPEKELSESDFTKLMNDRMNEVLKVGAELEQKYATAPNLYEAQQMMLRAADNQARQKTPGADAKVLEISAKILASPAGPQDRIQADFFITRDAAGKLAGKDEEATKTIRQFLDRYAKTDAAATSVVYGTIIANDANLAALRDELISTLEAKYGDDAKVRVFLRRLGRPTPFTAVLTKLDGSKLKLPDDLKGKVVVIDFWASWCPPCRAFAPKLVEIYNKYKDKGVEIVGISLDSSKEDMQQFLKANGVKWIQTFSGKYWNDPTAVEYEVRGIPSIWVLDRDGKVFSNDARDKLTEVLDKALAQPAPDAKGK